MTVCAQLQDLSRRLVARGERGRAVMIMPVRAGAGASWVSARLAANASRESGRPVWLYDLDFAANTQAGRTRLNGAAYDADFGTEPFWRADPEGSARLILRKVETAPVLVSVFERRPETLRRVVFTSAPAYWDRVRAACALALVDVPAGSPAATAIAGDLDGVILVGDAERTRRDEAEELADRIESAGGRVLGIVVNRAPGTDG
ncbi:hypothetical protein E5163_12760 [Marinicauda algicola]|uniref:CpsD/CapB family tyrosine-protein kinase n=1 Tax=Marinicauda algicola TaxID=2029849 RepID=A0A4S2GY35_9PROT|nr:CpsD/CapB family tyrosine-protein kinase [Marinicauda algicola]TGY87791.1 hypothetical protein E5163_12760 [Marinicauda algicola]